tara:strand:+ start:260 stop:532 length:273 start_codon:yes stop_codon:yes gene_type:complete
MKPTKKKPAKRKNNPVVTKLLNLKYRINDAYERTTLPTNHPNRLSLELLGDTRVDKQWVMDIISDVRINSTKLSDDTMKRCNTMWRKYEG